MSYDNAINQREEEIKILQKAKKHATKEEAKEIQKKITGLRKYIKELERKSK